MALSKVVGAHPWVTVGSVNGPAQWHDLISYLAAPAGFDAYADKRASHGRDVPWTDDFETIYLEVGNEWWNTIFQPFYVGDPKLYGELCTLIQKAVEAHPHYDAEKIQLVFGGWAINAHHWNGVVHENTPKNGMISIAPYLVHKLDAANTDEEAYGTLFAAVDQYQQAGGASTMKDLAGERRLAAYELNTHITGGSVSAERVSDITPSAAAGLAVLDQAMTLMAEMGVNPINYFTLLQRSHDGRVGLWGSLVRDADGTLRPRPIWQGLRLANQYLIAGDMVKVDVNGGATWSQQENGSVDALSDLATVHAFAFMAGDAGKRQVNLLLINRDLKAGQSVRVALPFVVKNRVKSVELKGVLPELNNETELEVALTESTLENFSGDTMVPPCSAVVYQFEEQ